VTSAIQEFNASPQRANVNPSREVNRSIASERKIIYFWNLRGPFIVIVRGEARAIWLGFLLWIEVACWREGADRGAGSKRAEVILYSSVAASSAAQHPKRGGIAMHAFYPSQTLGLLWTGYALLVPPR